MLRNIFQSYALALSILGRKTFRLSPDSFPAKSSGSGSGTLFYVPVEVNIPPAAQVDLLPLSELPRHRPEYRKQWKSILGPSTCLFYECKLDFSPQKVNLKIPVNSSLGQAGIARPR